MCLSQLLLHVVYFSFYVTSNKTITVRTVEEQEDILYDYKVELTGVGNRSQINTDDNALLHFCTMYYPFALAGHRGTCLRPLHIFALLCSGAGELQSLQSTLFTYGQQQQ